MGGIEHALPAAAALDLAAQRVEVELGLNFAGARRRQFEVALGRMAAALGHADAEACACWLLAAEWDEALSSLCARFLTVGETYFFREPRALDLVCELAQAHLARGERRPLRIWSAGCCTGEEPYSIAMTLRRRVPGLAPGMVSILATDLNAAFLEVARAGSYRRWSFRRTDPADQSRFFRRLDDGRFGIDSSLRRQIRFARLNLADGDYPSAASGTLAMDVIFCRNVLMYFSRDGVRAVVARLRDSLVEGGWLVVNASEAASELFAGFTPVCHEDAVFFQKRAAAPALSMPRMEHRPAPCMTPRMTPRMTPSAAPPPAPQAALAQPDDAMARVRALAGAGAHAEALQCLRRAVEAEPLSPSLQQSAALFALEHGDRALARIGVKRLLYLDPDSAMGHYLAALIEDAEGRRAQALRLLNDCRRLAALDAAAGRELGDAVAQWLERMR